MFSDIRAWPRHHASGVSRPRLWRGKTGDAERRERRGDHHQIYRSHAPALASQSRADSGSDLGDNSLRLWRLEDHSLHTRTKRNCLSECHYECKDLVTYLIANISDMT